jgi:hypothetical protein
MIRPGTKVNSPAMTSPPLKIPIMILRWRRTSWRCALKTAIGSRTSHQQHPDPADGPVRQRALGGCELDDPQRQRGHRRERMKGYRGRGIEQWRKTHDARLMAGAHQGPCAFDRRSRRETA